MMRAAGMPDVLVAVNGPQDGTEFTLSGRLARIGRDAACTVNLPLDNAIADVQAELSPAGGGYRVRSLAGTRTWVDGKRVGRVISRIAKPGSFVRIGHTDLVLECAADGPALRSVGISLENDFVWAIRNVTRRIVSGTMNAARMLTRYPRRVFRKHPILISTVAIALAVRFIPFFRGYAYLLVDFVKGLIASALA